MAKKKVAEAHPKGTNGGKTVYKYGVEFSRKKEEVPVG